MLITSHVHALTLFNSSHLELDLFGLSYHLGGSLASAPRGLDDEGVWVFNPGIGLTLDARPTSKEPGLSWMMMSGWFQDCDDKPFLFLGGGGRYRLALSQNVRAELNFGGLVVRASVWGDKPTISSLNGQIMSEGGTGEPEFYWTFVPILNIGISTHMFSDHWFTLKVSYAPKNESVSATSGGGLLFFTSSVSI